MQQQILEYIVPVTDANPGETPIYRHPMAKDGFIPPADPRKVNMQQALLIAFDKFPQKNTLGTWNDATSAYDHIQYHVVDSFMQQVKDAATSLGSYLVNSGLIQSVTDERGITIKPVGIYLKNRREWTLTDMACQLYGLTSCAFYDTLGSQSIVYALGITQTSICVCQTNTARVLANSNLPQTLKRVIVVEEIEPETVKALEEKNIQVVSWHDALLAGQKEQINAYPEILPDTPLTLVFTSGTTGQPKAAIQTHKNVVYMIGTFDATECIKIVPEDVFLSYLPLAHTFERMVHLACFTYGAEINYFSGNIQAIAQDIQRCKPTYFPSVPRLYNRFYEGIQASIAQLPEEMKAKFQQALQMKIEYFRQTGKTTHEQLDQAFAKTKLVLGGRQRLLVSGSAPIAPQILEFLQVVLCCKIIEGYGQTETCAASFLVKYSDPSVGHVGGPTITQEFKLVSVPDMGYLTDDVIDGVKAPRGEVCLRGPSVISGYFMNVVQTKETFDEDGWCHTGDVGLILPNGALKIIDRKKNFFKLAQGEYVSPEKSENIYQRVPGVSEVLVFGDSLRTHCVGVLVPEQSHLERVAKNLGVEGTREELCQNKQIRNHFLQACRALGVENHLNGFEQITNLYLEPKMFAQVGVLTETQKMQRHVAKVHYKDIIRDLYDEEKA